MNNLIFLDNSITEEDIINEQENIIRFLNEESFENDYMNNLVSWFTFEN